MFYFYRWYRRDLFHFLFDFQLWKYFIDFFFFFFFNFLLFRNETENCLHVVDISQKKKNNPKYKQLEIVLN